MTKSILFSILVLLYSACDPSIPNPSDAAAVDAPVDVAVDVPVDVPVDVAVDVPVDVPVVDASDIPDSPTHVTGSFALSVRTSHDTNCSPGGARIDTMELGLQDGIGACVPTTVQIEGLGEFALLCGQVNSVPCFEPTSRIISGPLDPGGYHLQVDGLRGSSLCWRGDASIGVTEGTPDEHTLFLLASPDTCVGVP